MRISIILTYLLTLSIFSKQLSAQETIEFGNYFFDELSTIPSSPNSNNSDLKTSWIDKAEIRTETDEFDFDRQRYALRITPSPKKVNKAIHNLMDAYTNKSSQINIKNLFTEINLRYDKILTAYNIELQKQLKSNLLEVYKDQDKVYKKLLDAKNSYTVRWLDVQKEISELEVDIFEMRKRRSLVIENNYEIDWTKMIDIQNIQESLLQLSTTTLENPTDTDFDIDNQIINQEIELRKAESNTYFDFLQVDYKGPSEDPIDERISITAAFQLPITDNKSKLKLAELRNEQAEIELKKDIEISERKNEIKNLYEELIILIEISNMRQDRLSEIKINSQTLSESYQSYSDPNPLFLLQQKELILKEEIEIAKIEGEIIESYVEYLSETGHLYALPFKNYLSIN